MQSGAMPQRAPDHVLEKILARTRADLAARMQQTPRAKLEQHALRHAPRGFATALRMRSSSGPAVIAELKKASPSKGVIRAEFAAAELAPAMESGGATALSVLTDEPFFQGSLANLEAASHATTIPCLRKDFIIDEYQIVEARAHGADAVLLIAAALSDARLEQLSKAARDYALDVLCEVHTGEEAGRIPSSWLQHGRSQQPKSPHLRGAPGELTRTGGRAPAGCTAGCRKRTEQSCRLPSAARRRLPRISDRRNLHATARSRRCSRALD